jgi:hypothetical protein
MLAAFSVLFEIFFTVYSSSTVGAAAIYKWAQLVQSMASWSNCQCSKRTRSQQKWCFGRWPGLVLELPKSLAVTITKNVMAYDQNYFNCSTLVQGSRVRTGRIFSLVLYCFALFARVSNHCSGRVWNLIVRESLYFDNLPTLSSIFWHNIFLLNIKKKPEWGCFRHWTYPFFEDIISVGLSKIIVIDNR